MDDLIRRYDAIGALLEKGQRSRRYKLGEIWELNFDEIREALATVPSAEPQWIPCSERLPEDDRTKVVALANGITEAGYYSNGDWWCIGDTVTLENPTVIAWMPLPKPYEVKE